MQTNRMLPGLIVGITFFLVLAAAAAAQSPSGSIALETAEGSSAGRSLWGGCTLIFKGKAHACSLTGLSVPLSGIARVSGIVYDLKDVGAFAGTYKAVGDDFALGAGHITVKNENGVSMILSVFGGLSEMQVADKGIEVKLK